MKKIGLGCLGIIIVLVIIGAIGAATGNKPEKVGTTTDTSKTNTSTGNESKPTTQTYKLGDQVKLKDNVVTVHTVADYTSSNQFIKPKDGNKFVVVDVSIKNDSKEAINYNLFDFKLQDDKDYSYSTGLADKEPSFSSGALQPGQSTRGFLSFEIPTGNQATKLVFTPEFLSTSQIIFELK